MPGSGLFGWISRFCGAPPELFCPASAPTSPPLGRSADADRPPGCASRWRHLVCTQFQKNYCLRKDIMIRVGVIGYGYWGPNIVRNFSAVDGFHVQTICDKNPESLQKVKKAYPSVHVTLDATEVLQSPEIDLVAVITPVWTHYELAKAALNNGKHVFVEKPFTYTSQQAEELVELADRKGLKIMVDHTFLFTGAVKKIRELVDNGSLGDLYYYDSLRVNLGLFQHDVNVI